MSLSNHISKYEQMKLSIVSPVYFGENIIEELVERISANISSITDNFEIILVEDGSPDKSWEVIEKICSDNDKVKGIKLSRNFGQHYAITAGLEITQGDWIVVMDCDLQDRPEEISNLFRKVNEGFDLVLARRIARQDSFLKRYSSRLFYTIFAYLTDSLQDPSVANFGIYNKKVIHSILSMNDYIRYFPTMSQWVGFNRGYLNVIHGRREEGESSYSWRKLAKLAFDNIIAFSDKPLRLTVKLGILVGLISILIATYYVFQYLTGNIVIMGYASLIVSIWFLSGIMIFTLGVVGIYVGKTFEKVKDRPTYIVSKRLNE